MHMKWAGTSVQNLIMTLLGEALEEESQNIRQNIITLKFSPEDIVFLYVSLFRNEMNPYELNG